MKLSSKKQGTIYEQIFVVRALQAGLEPHLTVGDYLPHDIVVSNAAGGTFRVQVKGTANPKAEQRNNPRYRITAGGAQGNRAKAPLDCSKVDVLGAYIEPEDAWYMIPCLKIKCTAVWLYPTTKGGSKGYYEQFREDWDYFFK